MAKTLDEAGVKRLIQEIKGANKNLNTPIPISTENTTESMAQNVKNIADYVEKAKAAGIANVNGMAVTCLIDNEYSGVGYFYYWRAVDSFVIQGVLIRDDLVDNACFSVDQTGSFTKRGLIVSSDETSVVTSYMLSKGARNPIILTESTTEVDGETYQKLEEMADATDVVFRTNSFEFMPLIAKDMGNELRLIFGYTLCDASNLSVQNSTCSYVVITVETAFPYKVTIDKSQASLETIINTSGYLNKSTLTPVLQEIDLTGTDAERKAKLDQFETDWKALTGADILGGARFVGKMRINDNDGDNCFGVFTYTNGDPACYAARVQMCYLGSGDGENGEAGAFAKGARQYQVKLFSDGSYDSTPLFSHLEAITIYTDNTTEHMQQNLDNIAAYEANLEALGVDVTKGYMIPIKLDNGYHGFIMGADADGAHTGVIKRGIYNYGGGWILIDTEGTYKYLECLTLGTYDNLTTTAKTIVPAINEVNALAKGVKAFGAIELKASDNAANKAAVTAYLKILTDAQVDTTNGYAVPVRITGNSQEYHGMLNIGTGVLLSGVVTDVNENHHYPFNVSTTDGAILFDENNYFLEKTSNEVTEMLDAIKYSHTSVPFTDTTLSNKAQLEVFLSKVPDATVMHCTYMEIWAGTLHKINGDWYGLLVKNTNDPADNINVKLSADGTIIKSNSAQ